MHATIPSLPQGIHHLMRSGINTGELNGELEGLLDRAGGRMLAKGMAILIKAGFGFLVCEGLDDEKAKKAQAFFEENFVMRDPNAEGGIRYYQGQFLIRTKKPEDDMNVYIRFCPDPDSLYLPGNRLNPAAIITTEAISEAEADEIERDPERVDLIIRFKDIKAILGLVERPDADVVQLLLENLVQITGNFGHMFKFGAIGKSAQTTLTGSD
ncbi:MAG: hypothetical protein L3J26_10960 [Candidatus Polarisedimenticolaceae bacterium]|nr:hypothetical protein [Candidatus Polarisedimenticolaceae bacterium]